jgi:hypothetical protein
MANVGKIDPHKQTLVDLEYFIHELRNKGHDVAIFIDANQNYRRCYLPQGHKDHFESKTGFNINGKGDGSLKIFLENTGLYNALNNKHGPENVPSAREPGSKVIDYVFVSEGLLPHITAIVMLSQDAVFASDHRTLFMDLAVESYFGHETDALPAKQLHQLQLDDPRIAYEYRKNLHKLFSTHKVYRRVTKISERSNSQEWSILDEDDYEKIDRNITRYMLSAAIKCGSNNKKRTPWSPALGMATQAIRYWEVRIKRQVKRNPADLVLNFYLMKSDVDKEAHDCMLPVQECIRKLNYSRQKL